MNEELYRRLFILGSTGSIGKQVLDIVDKYPHLFKVVGIAAKDEVDVLLEQIHRYKPSFVAVTDESAYALIKKQVGSHITVLLGMEGLCEIAASDRIDTVMVAVSGVVGILPTLEAIRTRKRIGLANKETLVAAGDIVMEMTRQNQVLMIPVDSEHSAVFQCMAGEEKYLKKIWLTASGGPFRDFSRDQLEQVTVEMALQHPNWTMGPKITVDSSTLMNKGLEVIEAHHLFNVDYDNIKVIVQKESIIHSMVELQDGSFIAHMGVADMRIPIQYALTYPSRLETPAADLDFTKLGGLHFQAPDKRFPALELAYHAGKIGDTMPAVLNAANEIAVDSFIRKKLKYTLIPVMVEKVMEKHNTIKRPDLEDIMQADSWARRICADLILKEVK